MEIVDLCSSSDDVHALSSDDVVESIVSVCDDGDDDEIDLRADDHWACSVCTTLNPLLSPQCASCGGFPGDVAAAQPPSLPQHRYHAPPGDSFRNNWVDHRLWRDEASANPPAAVTPSYGSTDPHWVARERDSAVVTGRSDAATTYRLASGALADVVEGAAEVLLSSYGFSPDALLPLHNLAGVAAADAPSGRPAAPSPPGVTLSDPRLPFRLTLIDDQRERGGGAGSFDGVTSASARLLPPLGKAVPRWGGTRQPRAAGYAVPTAARGFPLAVATAQKAGTSTYFPGVMHVKLELVLFVARSAVAASSGSAASGGGRSGRVDGITGPRLLHTRADGATRLRVTVSSANASYSDASVMAQVLWSSDFFMAPSAGGGGAPAMAAAAAAGALGVGLCDEEEEEVDDEEEVVEETATGAAEGGAAAPHAAAAGSSSSSSSSTVVYLTPLIGDFERALRDLLECLTVPRDTIDRLCNGVDFSTAAVDLLPSVPGDFGAGRSTAVGAGWTAPAVRCGTEDATAAGAAAYSTPLDTDFAAAAASATPLPRRTSLLGTASAASQQLKRGRAPQHRLAGAKRPASSVAASTMPPASTSSLLQPRGGCIDEVDTDGRPLPYRLDAPCARYGLGRMQAARAYHNTMLAAAAEAAAASAAAAAAADADCSDGVVDVEEMEAKLKAEAEAGWQRGARLGARKASYRVTGRGIGEDIVAQVSSLAKSLDDAHCLRLYAACNGLEALPDCRAAAERMRAMRDAEAATGGAAAAMPAPPFRATTTSLTAQYEAPAAAAAAAAAAIAPSASRNSDPPTPTPTLSGSASAAGGAMVRHPPLSIVFPSVRTVQQSTSGDAGHLCLTRAALRASTFPRYALREYVVAPALSGRRGILPHSKVMMPRGGGGSGGASFPPQRVGPGSCAQIVRPWAYAGSHNVSATAWGVPRGGAGGGSEAYLSVDSYELGVLMPPVMRLELPTPTGGAGGLPRDSVARDAALMAAYPWLHHFRRDYTAPQPLPVPFCNPPPEYDAATEPWAVEG